MNIMPNCAAHCAARVQLFCGVCQWRKRVPSRANTLTGTCEQMTRTGRICRPPMPATALA